MPNELFRAVAAREPSSRYRQSPVVFVSLLVHALVIGFVVTWQIADIGNLPSPRTALAFAADALHVSVADIELPKVSRPRVTDAGAPPATGGPSVAAPVVAPVGIAPETDREGLPAGPDSSEITGPSTVGVPDGTGLATTPAPSPPAPAAPIRLHSGIRSPRKVVDVAPVYPALARNARVQGLVILEATIDAQGNVASARVLRSIALLDEAALDAVRRWKFTPTLLNGVPVPIIMTVTVNFTLTP